MLAWSLAMLDDHDLIDGIVMVVPEEYEERASLLADDLCATKIAAAVPGGATRPESVAAGVACVPDAAAFVLVHDAARPLAPPVLVDRVVEALRAGADGAVPALRWPTRSSASGPTAASPRRSTGAPCARCRRRRAFPSRSCERPSPRTRTTSRTARPWSSTSVGRSSASRATSSRSRSRRRATSPAPSSWPARARTRLTLPRRVRHVEHENDGRRRSARQPRTRWL